jgi:hypothetical protein
MHRESRPPSRYRIVFAKKGVQRKCRYEIAKTAVNRVLPARTHFGEAAVSLSIAAAFTAPPVAITKPVGIQQFQRAARPNTLCTEKLTALEVKEGERSLVIIKLCREKTPK